MVGMKVKDGEAEDCIMEVYVPYSLTLNKSYDRFQFLEKLVVIAYLGQISRSLMEMNVSSWLRNNTLNWKKLLKVQVIIIEK